MYLEHSRGRRDKRERGLNTAGGISGESGLDKLPLEIEGGIGGGLDITFMLFSGPFAAGVAEDKCEDSHSYSERNPSWKLKPRREQTVAVTALSVPRIVYVVFRFWNPSAVRVKSPFSPYGYYSNFVNLG